VRDTAIELGIGDIIEWVPQQADPKNLFGLLSDAPATLPRAVALDREATPA
jgi:hypothetical protein